MLKLAVLVWGLVVGLSACATPSTMMVHPRTGDVQQCRAAGRGLAGIAMAESSHKQCVEQLLALGYKRGEDLTPEEKAKLPTK